MTNLGQALSWGKKFLRDVGVESFALDAMVLLRHAACVSKETIVFYPQNILSPNQEEDFKQMIARRANKEPVSHIIGKREFFGLDFFVNNKVLDPRPDSEILVEAFLYNLKNSKQIQFLEIGVGSGCLTISILKNLRNSSAIGLDVSFDALEICKKNAHKNEVENRLQLLQSNIFENISNQKFDAIISNPPYIKSNDIKDLQEEVRAFEPILALDGGDDGLFFYKEILRQAKNFLKPNGLIFLEIGYDQAQDVANIAVKNGFVVKNILQDLSQNDRVVICG